jgi:adenosylhomocysteine nucleosidase
MRNGWMCFLWAACVLCHVPSHAAKTAPYCLTDCSPRIGLVSAFGAEADLLVAQTRQRNGSRALFNT